MSQFQNLKGKTKMKYILASVLLALTLSANDDHRKGGKGDPPMSQTPEPGTWALTAGGFVALILARRMRKAK